MKFLYRAAPSFDLVLALCCALIASSALFLAVAGGREYLGSLDFRVYLTAGKMALSGTGAKFYDLPTQFAMQRELWPEMTSQRQLLPFLAPPFVAVLFAPLAKMPLLAGYAILTLVNAVLLWLIARGMVEELHLEGKKRLIGLALLLSFAPVLFAVMQGQVSLLVVLGFLQSWRAAKAGRDFSAGMWLCLLLIRPQMAFAPLLIFALKRRWSLLGGFALGATILGAISLFLVGFEGLASYKNLLGEVSNWKGIYGVQPQQMQTWRGFLHAAFASDETSVVRLPWILGVVAALGALFWCWRGPWQVEAPRFERQWAVLNLVALFCCPYLYSHDLSLLLVCGFLVFRAAQIEKSKLKALPIVGWAATLVWAVLLTASVPLPSLVVLFEAAAILVLAWSDAKISKSSSQAASA